MTWPSLVACPLCTLLVQKRGPPLAVYTSAGLALSATDEKTKIKWLSAPQKHDYPAARAYLQLIFQPREAKKLVDKLKRSKVERFAAKDIFRAAQVPLLPPSDGDVKKDRQLINH